jgi:hypothetical protein
VPDRMHPTLRQLATANPAPTVELSDALAMLPEVRALIAASWPSPAELPRERSRRRLLAVAIALGVVGAVIFGGPALGIGLPGLDFWHASKAPSKVVRDFATLGTGAPAGMDPEVVSGEARQVETVQLSRGQHTLWVAPTTSGGYCLTWSGFGGGCDRLGTFPLTVFWHSGAAGGSALVSGTISSRYADSVAIRFVDGRVVQPPVVWVSEPINQGFFIYEFDSAELQNDHRVSSIAALDRAGQLVTRESAPDTPGAYPIAPPVDAVTSQKQALIVVSTAAGAATVYRAPTRYDGFCAWLNIEGSDIPFAPCQPSGYDWGDGFTSTSYATHNAVLFLGTAGDRYHEIDLIYADGQTSRITPKQHLFLFSIPREHLTHGHQAVAAEARDLAGAVIPNTRFSVPSDGACHGVLPLATGETCADAQNPNPSTEARP